MSVFPLDRSISAPVLAEELQATYDSKGFHIWWAQYERELRRVEKWVMTSPPLATANLTAMELARRQGFLQGLRQIGQMTPDLLAELEKGRIPWKREDA